MATNPQTQAIAVTNSMISAAQQLMAVYQLMTQIDQQWTDQNVANITAAMATAVLNADGSIGAADGAPNGTHPITNPGLSRSISSLQIGQLKTILDGIVNYVGGSAVTTQVGARAILNVAVGG